MTHVKDLQEVREALAWYADENNRGLRKMDKTFNGETVLCDPLIMDKGRLAKHALTKLDMVIEGLQPTTTEEDL